MNEIRYSELILGNPQPLDQNAAAVYIATLAPTGKRTQTQALRVIAGMLGTSVSHLAWGKLRYHHTVTIRDKVTKLYKPSTANKILSALRRTLKQAWLLGQMSAEEFHQAVQLAPITGKTMPVGREISADEILALMTVCQADTSPAGTRDAAVIGLMYAAGLRREEMVNLTLENYDPDTGKLVLRGKRNKQRSMYITDGASDALNDWLSIRGPEAGALFVEVSKSGKVLTKRESMVVKPFRKIEGVEVPNKKAGMTIYRGGAMTPQAIYNMLAKRAQEAGIQNFSPHDLRRTFISHLLEAGADISTVSKLAGHANVQTTARYDRRPEEAKKKAAELLHVPYKPKA